MKRKIEASRGIITGASDGIGRALSIQLLRQGARLVAVARRQEKLVELAAEWPDCADRLQWVAGDITDPAIRSEAMERARSKFGGLDWLINNAGIGALGRFEHAEPERLRRVMEVNFFAAAELIRLALPELRKGNAPIVVNIGSILGHRGAPRSSEYCASKFALRGLSESLRAEFAYRAIDLLLVSPGSTDTSFFEHAIEPGVIPWPVQPAVSADKVARETIKAMRRGKHEIIVNARGKLLVYMNRFFPRLIDALMARYG